MSQLFTRGKNAQSIDREIDNYICALNGVLKTLFVIAETSFVA